MRLPDGLALREVLVRGIVETASDGPHITVTDASQIAVLPVEVEAEAVLSVPVDSDAPRNLYAANRSGR